ncbi:NAD-dependent epimerase/dehydratase family protein [Oceanobacter mangrovi]|uniref:NAD-dependent epimerase/dehydratase family protein n=1 Tax=Oceanobacter mangrovi TaxID=2862510 RepID=UPI001C8EC0A0|nr:NAD-dependent epimerase/dehydratase family protein [Oceanobacter mangrovi]
MNKVLIFGITGALGRYMAQACLAQGWQVTGHARQAEKLAAELSGQVDLVNCPLQQDDPALAATIASHDIIIYAANPPYQLWQQQALPMLEAVLGPVENFRKTLFFPANLYIYDPKLTPEVNENSPAQPVTAKGQLRLLMEQRLRQAGDLGAQIIMMRCGDFIGADAPNSWIPQLLKLAGKQLQLRSPGDSQQLHSWAWLGDYSKVAVVLLQRRQQLGNFSCFHFRGYCLSIQQLAATLQPLCQQPVKISTMPWWPLYALALVMPLLREVIKMRYLWQWPLALDDSKLRNFLADQPELLQTTPIAEALLQAGLIPANALTAQSALTTQPAALAVDQALVK